MEAVPAFHWNLSSEVARRSQAWCGAIATIRCPVHINKAAKATCTTLGRLQMAYRSFLHAESGYVVSLEYSRACKHEEVSAAKSASCKVKV